jgi:acetoin utilization deacetylase AcuC-like enzyme
MRPQATLADSVMAMVVLLGLHEAFVEHDTGHGHPERPSRLGAVLRGVRESGLDETVSGFAPRPATTEELGRAHDREYISFVERFCQSGGGHLDADTVASEGSWAAACRAAGAGLDAMERLRGGEGEAAFLAVRPPGHHALAGRQMGFCLFNNVAVAAAGALARNERVAIVDWDAHHGNGTQEIFYAEPDVLYVSLHQYPFYPGTGSAAEMGAGPGLGSTVNFPFPAGTRGDAYRLAFDDVIGPAIEAFGPDWLFISAGFDAHREDPITDLGLSAGDFTDLTAMMRAVAPAGRMVAFLEGGYDLAALELSVAACVAGLAGERLAPEPATSVSGDEPAVGEGRIGGLVAEVRRRREELGVG